MADPSPTGIKSSLKEIYNARLKVFWNSEMLVCLLWMVPPGRSNVICISTEPTLGGDF